MPLIQSIDSALHQNIGQHGVSAEALDAALERTEGALDWLRARHADGGLPLLNLPEATSEIPELRDTARALADRATDIVLLGTGGSALGGQTFAHLAGHMVPGVGALRPGPRLHFMDNLDPDSFASLLKHLPLPTSRFVSISKSGGTGETLMQTIAVLSALHEANLGPRIPDIFLGLTEPAKPGKKNGLRELLGQYKVPMLKHHTGVGGRFSVLTNVGLLPAAMLGLDVVAVRGGAALALMPVL